MSDITLQFIVTIVLAGTVLHGQDKLEPRRSPRRFVSKKYGFSVEIPPGWYAAVGGNTPFYFNFRPNTALGQGSLPNGGATLNIVPQDELPGRRHNASLTEWLAEDTRRAKNLLIDKMEIPSSTEIAEANRASWDVPTYSADDQAQHETSIYWKFRGHLFAVHLIYLVNDPKGPEYEKLLANEFRSIRPLSAP